MKELTTAGPARTRAPLGAGLVLLSCLSVQASAALASTLFDRLGAPSVAGLRQLCAAFVLMALVRPRVRGHTRREWAGMVVYGAAMAVMNVAYYCAVSRLPLGVAATLLFLGPFVVAVASARAWREALFPVVGLAGVVLVTEPGGEVEWAGMAFGLLSALALACYTVFAQRVGRASSGLEGLAVSVCISAVLLLPFSVPAAPNVDGSGWGLVAVSGAVGVALAFTLDFQAVKLAGAKVVATLFSLDPVMGALIGALALAEALSAPVLVGMGLIVSAGAVVTWRADSIPVHRCRPARTARDTATGKTIGSAPPGVAPAAVRTRPSPRSTTTSATRSNAGSIASSRSAPLPPDGTSSPSAMRRPSWSQFSTHGSDWQRASRR